VYLVPETSFYKTPAKRRAGLAPHWLAFFSPSLKHYVALRLYNYRPEDKANIHGIPSAKSFLVSAPKDPLSVGRGS
jgi:hypothetical protein